MTLTLPESEHYLVMAAAVYYIARFGIALAVPLVLSALAPTSETSPVHTTRKPRPDASDGHVRGPIELPEARRPPIKLKLTKGQRKVLVSRGDDRDHE